MDDRRDLRRALRVASRFVDRFVLVGNRLRPYYTDRVRIPSGRMSVIPNGIDVDRFVPGAPAAAARAALGLPTGFLIGSAGRLTWEKNFTLLLRGVHAARRRGVNVCLALMGDGTQRAELGALADSLGIRDAVTFLGWRTDTDRILPLLDAYVVSSATEGLPLAVLEAMACAIPILSTPVGEMPLLLGDGNIGELYAPDPEALADVLVRTATQDEQRRQRGRAARVLATRQYSAAAMVDAYVGAYVLPPDPARLDAREPVGPPALER
jgi:glycosyltransferase involved in cell wall biosynthesis